LVTSIEELFPFDPELGYIGILVLSFVFSIIPFIPVPYFPLLITATFNPRFDPNMIALSSAVGSVAAKTVIFLVSCYGRKILSDGTKKRMLPLQKLVSRYGWASAFAAALTPIPDDLVYIPLGLAKYSPWRFAIATFAGKLTMNEIIVWGSVYLGRPFVENLVAQSSGNDTTLYIAALASIAVLGVLIYYSLKINWSKIIGKWFPWTLEENDGHNTKKDL